MVLGKEEKAIDKEKITEMVEKRYAGEVTAISLEQVAGEVVYKCFLKGKTGTYQIMVDAYQGRVEHITPMELAPPEQKPAKVEDDDDEPDEQKKHATTGKKAIEYISLDRARKIAMAEVKGQFDGIEVEEVNGAPAFEVEIDTVEDQEVKVLVDAVTGEIISVLWED